MSRKINNIIIHCSATKEGIDVDIKTIRKWHLARGFRDVGYHYLIRLDGSVQIGRLLSVQGAHVKGHNEDSIGVCYVGGLDLNGKSKDTRTPAQLEAMKSMIWTLTNKFPQASVSGHRDFSPDLNKDGEITSDEFMKDCPCFFVSQWLAGIDSK